MLKVIFVIGVPIITKPDGNMPCQFWLGMFGKIAPPLIKTYNNGMLIISICGKYKKTHHPLSIIWGTQILSYCKIIVIMKSTGSKTHYIYSTYTLYICIEIFRWIQQYIYIYICGITWIFYAIWHMSCAQLWHLSSAMNANDDRHNLCDYISSFIV